MLRALEPGYERFGQTVLPVLLRDRCQDHCAASRRNSALVGATPPPREVLTGWDLSARSSSRECRRARTGGSRLLLAAPLVVLLLAAGVQAVRLPALTMLVVGLVVLRLTRRPVADAWAACVPIAVSLAWGIGGQPSDASDGSDCANPLSPPATWRLAEAVLVLAAVGLYTVQ